MQPKYYSKSDYQPPTDADIVGLIEHIGTKYKCVGNEIRLERCPYCMSTGKGDLYTSSINRLTGVFGCFRGSCTDGGKSFYQLCKDTGYTGYTAFPHDLKNDTFMAAVKKWKEKRQKALELSEEPPKEYDTTDRTEYYLSAMNKLRQSDITSWRGISKETLLQYGVGYDTGVICNQYVDGYFIIPVTKSCYIYRARDKENLIPTSSGNMVKSKRKYNTLSDVYPRKILKTMQAGEKLFIVEGEVDALSGLQIGLKCVAILGTSNTDKLIQALNTEKETNPQLQDVVYIVALDNDTAGSTANKELYQMLIDNGYKAHIMNICGEYKDLNEVLQNEC